MKAHRTKRLCRRLLCGTGLTVLVIAQLIWTLPLQTHAQDKLCFKVSGSPVIDGVLASDSGWAVPVTYVFNNGSPEPHTIVRMVRDFSNVYISFEVNNDPSFENDDVIALAIGPDADATHDQRILIYPVATGVGNANAAPGGKPRLVEYWTNSTTWNSTTKLTNPIWLRSSDEPGGGQDNIRVTSSNNVVPMKSYIVEVRLPINADPALGINFPAGGDFKLYFNIIRVTTNMGSIEPLALDELKWPTTASPIAGADPAFIGVSTNTPARTDWGTGTTNTGTCTGVSILSIGSNNADPTLINVNSTNNVFNAQVTNTGSAAASGVRVTFRSYRFGIAASGLGNPLPAPNNPTAASGTINPGDTVTLSTGGWDVLNDPNRPQYVANPSICVQGTLSSTGGGTLISNPITYLNMHFGTASKFEHQATIDARGFEDPPDGAPNQQFFMFTSTKVEAQRGGQTPTPTPQVSPTNRNNNSTGPSRQVAATRPERARLTRIYHVYRKSGRFIEIHGKKYRVAQAVNSYGYFVDHIGAAVAKWDQNLSGNGLKQIRDGVFNLVVPKNGDVKLTTKVEAKEQKIKKCFQGGTVVAPFGSFAGMILLGVVLYGWKRRGRKRS